MKSSPPRSVPYWTRIVASGPFPGSSVASSTVPWARRSGLALRSSSSACSRIWSSSSCTFLPVLAEIGVASVVPPNSSSTTPCASRSCFTFCTLAVGRAILLNAGVPLVVAINKIDLPTANVQKVKQDLLAHGVVLEEFGGTTLATPVSAKTGQNVEELLDQILLQAELLDLKANPERRAQGTVLEATLDPGKGPLATILVQNGTLRGGDDFICGQFYGRVRAMYDERGQTVDAAGPSTPVQVLGFEGVPEAGDTFQVMTDAAAARDIAQKRQRLEREAQHRRTGRVKTLEDFMAERAEGGAAALRIIIKADQGGPAEALADALAQLSTPEVKVEVVHRGVGAITDSDVLLAKASGARL